MRRPALMAFLIVIGHTDEAAERYEKALFLDPHLPPWLPEITLGNLHVGKAVVAIRFYRERDGTSSYEVLDKWGHLHVVRQPSPWSLTASPAERLVDILTSALPTL